MKITTLLITFFLFVNGFSQTEFNPNIEWSDAIEYTKKDRKIEMIGIVEKQCYYLKHQGTVHKPVLFVQKLNENFIVQGEKKLSLEYNKQKLKLKETFVLGDKIRFLMTYGAKKKVVFLVFTLQNDLSISEPVEIASLDGKQIAIALSVKKIEKVNGYQWLTHRYMVSEGKQKFMFSYRTDPVGANSKSRTTLLYDSDFNEVGQSTVTIPLNNFYPELETLTDDGILYSVGYETQKSFGESMLNKSERNVLGDYVFVNDIKNGELKQIPIEVEGKYIHSVNVKMLENQDYVLYGLYSNSKQSEIIGSFISKRDKNDTKIFTSLDEFDLQKIDYRNSNSFNESIDISSNLIISDLIINDYGEMTLLTEEYYEEIVTTYVYASDGSPRPVYNTHRHYEDVLIFQYSIEGTLQWSNLIPRLWVSINERSRSKSYFYVDYHNEVLLLFNTHNLLANVDKKKKQKNIYPTAVKMDKFGNSISFKLYDFEEPRSFSPGQSKVLDDQSILLVCFGKRKFWIAKMN